MNDLSNPNFSQMESKKLAAEKAVETVKDGMTVGLGTGTTAYWAIQKIAERAKEGLRIQAVATSLDTERLAKELGIPLVSFSAVETIDLTIDGADEVDKDKNLLKGGGGALLREKIVAYHSKQYLVVVDESKRVDQLGRFPLPLEILPFAMELTLSQLRRFGEANMRQKDGSIFRTDNGNFIADLQCYPINDPQGLDSQLRQIPGVLETGLFSHTLVSNVIIGKKNGDVVIG